MLNVFKIISLNEIVVILTGKRYLLEAGQKPNDKIPTKCQTTKKCYEKITTVGVLGLYGVNNEQCRMQFSTVIHRRSVVAFSCFN